MGFACPKCSEDISEQVEATIKGRVDRARAVADAKDAELQVLQRHLKEARDKVAASAADLKELGELRAERERTIQVQTLAKYDIPESAADDVLTLFRARMGARPEEERVTLDAFLGEDGEGRRSVLLEPYFAGAATASSSQSSEPQTAGLGSSDGGTPPASPRSRKASPADLRSYLQSAEYRGLSAEKQREKLAELKATYGTALKSPE